MSSSINSSLIGTSPSSSAPLASSSEDIYRLPTLQQTLAAHLHRLVKPHRRQGRRSNVRQPPAFAQLLAGALELLVHHDQRHIIRRVRRVRTVVLRVPHL